MVLELNEKLNPRHGLTVSEEKINNRVMSYNENAFINKMFTADKTPIDLKVYDNVP